MATRWGRPAALALCLWGALGARGQVGDKPGGVVTRYVDPKQQTAVYFGARSHWLQPWRAYLDTVPTARLREAVGINLNVEPDEADAVCRHLAKNGFRKVRVEFGWGSVSYDEPKRLADPARFEKIVGACRKYRLRPLFLLNAHHGAPCPTRFFNLRLAEPAKKGDRTLRLDPASVSAVVPGRTGLNNLTEYWAPEALITKVDADGAATLSKPLPKDLPAGETPAATLRFLPFYPAKRKADGKTPPEFEETMGGWLDYAALVCREAKRVLGTEGKPDAGFDLEVWNELTFGSNFLNINSYYEKPLVEGDGTTAEILRRTVAWAVAPARRLPGVGVSDGFNNQWPWGAGSTAPPGLAALGKHPYAGARRFPRDQGEPGGIRPLDALGRPDGVEAGPGRWKDLFVPAYVAHFPEYFLCAIQTEHLVRDLSPITTDIYGVKHGRNTRPKWPNGRPAPAPQMWITEVNLDPNGADPGDLTAYTAVGQPPAAPGLTPADADRMKAKAVLRYLVSYVNKGPVRFYFYAAKDDNPLGLHLVSRDFFRRLKANGHAYPADDAPLTSPAMRAVRRLVAAMPGGTAMRAPRALSLLHIAEDHGNRQFDGDPATAAQNPDPHPPLYNRECLAFFPFQAADNRFVIPLYVMTRNLTRRYQPAAAGRPGLDLPAEMYRLTIGGVRGMGAKVTLFDPLDGKTVPLRTLGAGTDRLIVEVPLTDSPRLLTITESIARPPGAGRKP